MRFPDRAGNPRPNYFFEVLAFSAQEKGMQGFLAEFTASEGKPEEHFHEGAEFLYVLTGEVAILFEGEEHVLAAGDCVYFDSSEPHGYRGITESRALVVTTPSGGVLYWNPAHEAMFGTSDSGALAALETAISGDPEASQAFFRLNRAAERGETRREEIRLKASVQAPRRPVWLRIGVRPFPSPVRDPIEGRKRDGLVLWQVTDITDERNREAQKIGGLEAALVGFDSMPMGFLSVAAGGPYNAGVLSDGSLRLWGHEFLAANELALGEFESALQNFEPAERYFRETGGLSYLFEVFAANSQGRWSDQPARLNFKVGSMVYERWWFWWTFCVLLTIGVAGLIRARMNRQRELVRAE